MLAQTELTRLAAQKAALRRDIKLRRGQCVLAAAHVAKPVEWLDQLLVLKRSITPLAPLGLLPLALTVQRRFAPRLELVGALIRWAPVVLSVARSLRQHGTKPAGHRSPS